MGVSIKIASKLEILITGVKQMMVIKSALMGIKYNIKGKLEFGS